jgi:serine/threonine protein phosphatase PrpC
MIAYFSKTNIGYSHRKEEKPCQDYSACYHDDERTILTACDGHGGKLYIRSELGSRYASNAIITVLQRVEKTLFYRYTRQEICDKIRLQILCEWNALVERHLSEKSFLKRELADLDEEQIFKLKQNPVKAYGTTLQGAMIFGNKLICVSLGDGGVFLVRKGALCAAFEEDEDTVANLTYSMCQEDAYKHLKVEIFDFSDLDGVLLCTDGVVNPYQSFGNFRERFVKPICIKLLEGKHVEIDEFITAMGEKIGIGDDVSLALAIKSGVSLRGYRRENEI